MAIIMVYSGGELKFLHRLAQSAGARPDHDDEGHCAPAAGRTAARLAFPVRGPLLKTRARLTRCWTPDSPHLAKHMTERLLCLCPPEGYRQSRLAGGSGYSGGCETIAWDVVYWWR